MHINKKLIFSKRSGGIARSKNEAVPLQRSRQQVHFCTLRKLIKDVKQVGMLSLAETIPSSRL